jgi:hypothetical protein
VETPAGFSGAVYEFHRYLSDQVAPLMVVDEITTLLHSPPDAVAGETVRWIDGSPRASQADRPDQLMHAIQKIAQMGEFDLVPRAELGSFLNDYAQELLERCPPDARAGFVRRVTEFGAQLLAPGSLLYEPPPPEMSPQVQRRIEVFLDQLEAEAEGERRDEVASEYMTTVALEASTREQLEERLAPLRNVGISPETENVLNSIAKSLPGWGALESTEAGAQPGGARLGAMQRIVSLGEGDEEIAKRFRELVHSAIAQFNADNIGRAQSILAAARQMIAEGRVKEAYVDSLRNASDYLDIHKLRAASEKPELYPALRTILAFFHSLGPEGLVASLRKDIDEAGRRDYSALLEIHGPEGRAAALAALASEPPQHAPNFTSSLLRILRRIPRPKEVAADAEVDVAVKFTGRGVDPLVARQAIYLLGQTANDKAERALIGLLRVYEGLLTRAAAGSVPTAEEASDLLSRVCGGLARCGTPRALKAMVDHGLKSDAALGDCAARIVEATRVDFSKHPDLLKRLVDALKAELPRGVLGIRLRKDLGRAASFTRALSGTPHPDVKGLFDEIVKKHGDEEVGTLAATALEGFGAKEKPPEPAAANSISGDLGFFGLPMLLQTLAQGSMTGLLTLFDSTGAAKSQMWVENGLMLSCTLGRLEGETALYELMIRPFPGTFAFVNRTDPPEPGPLGPRNVMNLVFEGVRRHDEWKRAAAVVADGARFTVTGQPRALELDETEDFIETVWAKAAGGASAAECEAAVVADSYRTRRLLAAWVERQALNLAAA